VGGIAAAFPGESAMRQGYGGDVPAPVHGWYLIDLLPAFRAAAARDGAPLFQDLWHPTARGHAIAAEAVAAQLPPPGGWPIRCTS